MACLAAAFAELAFGLATVGARQWTQTTGQQRTPEEFVAVGVAVIDEIAPLRRPSLSVVPSVPSCRRCRGKGSIKVISTSGNGRVMTRICPDCLGQPNGPTTTA
jgi:hypothetical protein